MKLKKAEEKLSAFLGERGLIDLQEQATVTQGNNKIHDGREAWILHTLKPENGIYVVYRNGDVKDFYKVDEH
jgi:hypothetical protein